MDDQNEPFLTPREKAFLAQNPEVELVKGASRPLPMRAEGETTQELVGQPGSIAGWLLVLVVFLIIATIQRGSSISLNLQSAERANSALQTSPEWQSLTTKVWSVYWIGLIVCGYTVYRLLKVRTSQTVKIAIASLWLLGPVQVLINLILMQTENDISQYILVSSILPAIWTAYLLKSKRIRNTYPVAPVAPSTLNEAS